MAGDIPGPKPVLENEELLKKIKQCIIDGKNLEETANICEINRDSFYCWHSDNYLKIADKIEGWKRDRKVMLASRNVDEILQMPKEKESLKVVADMSKFVLEVLDKNYKQKQDITTDGEKITGFNYVNPANNQTPSETTPSVGDTSEQEE